MRTYVRVDGADDPARRPRRVLRLGRAARRPAAARPARHRRRRGRARGELRGEGVRRPHGDGRRQARRLCPHAVVVPPRMSAYAEASKAVFEVFDDTTPLVEGLSIDEAFLDVRGLRADRRARRPRSPCGCGGRSASRSGCRSPSAWRGPSSSPRWRAAWPSPTGCSSCRPDGELAFLHPLPVERLWGVGPVTAAKLHGRGHHDRGRGRRSSPSRRSWRCSAARRAGTSTPWPTTAIPGPCRRAGGGARSARSARSAGARDRPTTIDADPRRPRRPGHPPDARRRPRRPHRRPPAPLRRLLPRDPLAHAAPGDGADRRRSSTPRERCSPRPCRLIETQGLTLVGICVTNLEHDGRGPARAAVRPPGRRALDAALDRVRDRFGSRAVTRAVLLGRDPGVAMPLLPD